MIAIVSHDTGGAEILSSWIRQNQQPYCLVLEGPAISIFQRKLGSIRIDPLAKAIELSESVLCGSSWQSTLEKQAIVKAKRAGKKVITFLDHWVNYSERFQLDGKIVLPDEIWVGDVDALLIAQNLFSGVQVVLHSNPYLKDLQMEMETIQSSPNCSKPGSVLYVCEPIREHALLAYGNELYWGYTEEDALQFFLKNIDALGSAVGEIKIRPRPSESNSKYDWARQANHLVSETASTKSLMEQIVETDVVVGCESMAMVVALLAKKRVISAIPPGGKVCSLPQTGIEHMQMLTTKFHGAWDA